MDKGRLMHTADGRAFFCCILTDITELRETTRMLEVSLERHRIIMEHTDEIIFEFNRRTRELTVSPNSVSYTHLDVYKRQTALCRSTSSYARDSSSLHSSE